ncbi:MAG: carotenoid isomerase [Cyanophyceae cyanobacterium]
MGGLVTATQLVAKGAKVVVLERYVIPGGSAGYFDRQGYRFDVGASMIFGFGTEGTTNLLTRALNDVDMAIETIPDPVQIHYHLPDDLDLKVHKEYEDFIQELTGKFPHEKEGIRQFYDECWKIFNCLNAMELLSLEEPRYLARVFFQHPFACLGLVKYLPQNVGDIARRYISDSTLLQFIDMECYCWSVVPANLTPAINGGMVFSDRHYGGINYPKGGVGKIAQKLVEGLENYGGKILYRANVTKILTENGKAVGVKLSNGKEIKGKRVISNATRWDTFDKLWGDRPLPNSEKRWKTRYKKSPSFFSLHMGIDAKALPKGTECHHILLDNWQKLEDPYGTLFVSIPTLLDPDLAPEGRHIIHAFTPAWVEDWDGIRGKEYKDKKLEIAYQICDRLSPVIPNLRDAIDLLEVGTPRTHRKFLNREDGTYGPIPQKRLMGLLGMPFNRTSVPGLYCVGDSTFPGQGLNAVAFSGYACAHRVAADLKL